MKSEASWTKLRQRHHFGVKEVEKFLKNFRHSARRLKEPLVWDSETFEVRDADGRMVALAGPCFMAAIKKHYGK